jgi:hypothetical protein
MWVAEPPAMSGENELYDQQFWRLGNILITSSTALIEKQAENMMSSTCAAALGKTSVMSSRSLSKTIVPGLLSASASASPHSSTPLLWPDSTSRSRMTSPFSAWLNQRIRSASCSRTWASALSRMSLALSQRSKSSTPMPSSSMTKSIVAGRP